jgi:hypothetical protein
MRFFTFILACYMLVLSIVPCCDAHTHNSSNNVLQELTQQYPHEDSCEDICSPFCICSCCSVTVVVPKVNMFSIEKIFMNPTEKKITYTNMPFSFMFLHNIWQPPKIS